MNMKTYTEHGAMEFGEKVLRGGVGLIMIETVFWHPGLTPAVIAGLIFAALYLVFTAIIGRDPVYALAKGAHEDREPVKGIVTPYPAPSRVAVAKDHKKAA
jgi:hypothetical protein